MFSFSEMTADDFVSSEDKNWKELKSNFTDKQKKYHGRTFRKCGSSLISLFNGISTFVGY